MRDVLVKRRAKLTVDVMGGHIVVIDTHGEEPTVRIHKGSSDLGVFVNGLEVAKPTHLLVMDGDAFSDQARCGYILGPGTPRTNQLSITTCHRCIAAAKPK